MEIMFSPHFKRKFSKFTERVHKSARKQFKVLVSDFHHPSLHAKKYSEKSGVWQARIDRSHRFYFLVKKGMYILLDINKHKK